MNNQQHQSKTTNLSDSVLMKIERDGVSPRSRFWFWLQEYGIWVLWGLSVLIGAIAFSVMEMVWDYRSNDIYEATHASFLQFSLAVLPYVWILVFAGMTMIAYHNLRHTKRGYRYPFTHIVLSSLAFTLLAGLVLHQVGVGTYVDRVLGETMPMYLSQQKMELRLWQQPTEGRLVGAVIKDPDDDFAEVVDISGSKWLIYVRELREADKAELMRGKNVRILGLPATESNLFYACGVFPWIFDPTRPHQEMSGRREAFLTRMYTHYDETGRLEGFAEEALVDRRTGRCAELEIIERIREEM